MMSYEYHLNRDVEAIKEIIKDKEKKLEYIKGYLKDLEEELLVVKKEGKQ